MKLFLTRLEVSRDCDENQMGVLGLRSRRPHNKGQAFFPCVQPMNEAGVLLCCLILVDAIYNKALILAAGMSCISVKLKQGWFSFCGLCLCLMWSYVCKLRYNLWLIPCVCHCLSDKAGFFKQANSLRKVIYKACKLVA